MILSYADINDQQKKKYMKRVKRAYEDGKVRERSLLFKGTNFCDLEKFKDRKIYASCASDATLYSMRTLRAR